MRNKKGVSLFFPLLFLVLLINLLVLSSAIYSKSNSQPFTVGKVQSAILALYEEVGKEQFFIDISARQAARDTYYKLAKQGGTVTPCGDYFGYNMIVSENVNCKGDPLDLSNIFTQSLKENLVQKQIITEFKIEITDTKVKGTTELKETKPVIISQENDNSLPREETKKKVEEASGKTNLCVLEPLVDVPSDILCKNNACKGTETMINELIKAQERAKSKGYNLIVTSSYRDYDKQTELYNCFKNRDKLTGACPKGCSSCNEAAKPSCASPHLTAKTVDVFLQGEANMNTGSKSNNKKVTGIKEREILQEIMCNQDADGNINGFVRYGDEFNTKGEFWHYEYQTTRWERGTNLKTCAIV